MKEIVIVVFAGIGIMGIIIHILAFVFKTNDWIDKVNGFIVREKEHTHYDILNKIEDIKAEIKLIKNKKRR